MGHCIIKNIIHEIVCKILQYVVFVKHEIKKKIIVINYSLQRSFTVSVCIYLKCWADEHVK